MNKLQFSTVIAAPRAKVWDTMLQDATYRQWTSVWMPGSHYAGEWSEGSKILFIAPDEEGKMDGMISRITAYRPHEYVAAETVGMVQKDNEVTDPARIPEKERGWIGAVEDYTLANSGNGKTELTVTTEVPDEYVGLFQTTWPKALEKLKELAEEYWRRAPKNSKPRGGLVSKTFYIETFGCQMNVHDSEKVAGILVRSGYEAVENPEAADLVLYNTCSIREKAAQKVFSRLQQFRRAREQGRKFAVLGCVAQQEGEKIFEAAPHVSLVAGSASYSKLPELIGRLEQGERRVTGLSLDTEETFETEFTRRDHPFRAYITIIEGCDKRCAYCVVPFTRGPERSRASGNVLEEARRLAEAGYTEIQVLGQNVNSYRDPSAARMSFAELLGRIAEVPGIRRMRFTTSHPRDFGKDIVEAMDAHAALCNHVHLPVQSGSTRVLRSMQREYSREEYMQRIAWIRAARRTISISTDIIVGFPGETDADFEETITLLDEVGYDSIFSFQYSPRPNTGALHLPNSVPEEEKGLRLRILQDRQRSIQLQRYEKRVGSVEEVLVEGRSGRGDQWKGRTTVNIVLNFTEAADAAPVRAGDYWLVRVTGAGPNSLTGEAVEGPVASGRIAEAARAERVSFAQLSSPQPSSSHPARNNPFQIL